MGSPDGYPAEYEEQYYQEQKGTAEEEVLN